MDKFETWWQEDGQETLYALNTLTDADAKTLAEIAWEAALAEQAEQEPVGRWNWNEAKFEWLTKFDYYKHHMTPLYTAPVRTKDLTDDEIMACRSSDPAGGSWLDSARAVIAKFKEKNK